MKKQSLQDMREKTSKVKEKKKIFIHGGLARKVIALILSILLIPIVIINMFSLRIAVSSVLNESQKSYITAVSTASQYFQTIFKSAREQIMEIISNEIIQQLYSSSKQAGLSDNERRQIKSNASKLLQNVLATNQMFSGVYLIADKERSLFLPYFPIEYLDFFKIKLTKWWKKITEKETSFFIESLETSEPIILESHKEAFDEMAEKHSQKLAQYAFSVGIYFRDVTSDENTGVAILDISEAWLRETLQNNRLSKDGGYMLMVSPAGKIIIPSLWDVTMKSIPTSNTPFIFKVIHNTKKGIMEGAFQTMFDGRFFLVTYAKIPEYEWIIVGMVPLNLIISSAKKLELIIVLLTVVFAIIAVVIGIYFVLKMTKDIEKIADIFAVAEKGDFTVEVNIRRRDEIGMLSQSFNKMVRNMKTLVEKGIKLSNKIGYALNILNDMTTRTAIASNEVGGAIQNVAKGAESQAKEATRIVETIAKFTEKIGEIVGAANKMKELSQNVLELSKKGSDTVSALGTVNTQTVNVTTELIKNIQQLSESSLLIEKIIKFLSTISGETKLLALNASIEAARVGNTGSGFKVVASEIRKLADQSKESTREVEVIVERVIEQTKDAQYVANKMEMIIEQQNEAVRKVAHAFEEIRGAIDQLFKEITKVTDSLEMIDKEKGVILRSVENISAISQETAASTEEVLAATEEQLEAIERIREMAEQLNTLSKDLLEAMKVFKI